MNRKSFTLLEVLAVMAIIVILFSIVSPIVSSSRERSKRVSCKNNLSVLGKFFNTYADGNRGFLSPRY